MGTGKNFTYYPTHVAITGIDLTPGMLVRARKRAATLSLDMVLLQSDVQALTFADKSFDEVIATFVFCSLPDPVLGLRELARVVKPGGRVLLLEHMRAANSLPGFPFVMTSQHTYLPDETVIQKAMEALMQSLGPVLGRMISTEIPGKRRPRRGSGVYEDWVG